MITLIQLCSNNERIRRVLDASRGPYTPGLRYTDSPPISLCNMRNHSATIHPYLMAKHTTYNNDSTWAGKFTTGLLISGTGIFKTSVQNKMAASNVFLSDNFIQIADIQCPVSC